jgi:hypothetical protein
MKKQAKPATVADLTKENDDLRKRLYFLEATASLESKSGDGFRLRYRRAYFAAAAAVAVFDKTKDRISILRAYGFKVKRAAGMDKKGAAPVVSERPGEFRISISKTRKFSKIAAAVIVKK